MSMQLVTVHNNRFQMNEEARRQLLAMDDGKLLGVISIVGRYRTGKSFLLNNILMQEEAFSVGPTINPCTKGIWVGKNMLKMQNMNILVLDVEGFGMIDEQRSNSRIFLMPLLLSSYLLYNSVGNITEQAVRSLGLIVGLAREVQLKWQTNENFPIFHWILRDFALQLEDSAGKPISPQQYLEKALEEQKGLSESVEQRNRIRRNFKDFFPKRECSTLLKPTATDQDTDSVTQFRPQFIEQGEKLRKVIMQSIEPKTINNIPLTLYDWINLLDKVIAIINDGSIPNIENVWRGIALNKQKQQIQQIGRQLLHNLDSQLISESPFTIQNYVVSHFKHYTHPQLQFVIDQTIAQTVSQIRQFSRNQQIQRFQQAIHVLYQDILAKIENDDIKTLLDLNNLWSTIQTEEGTKMIETQIKNCCLQALLIKHQISIQNMQKQKAIWVEEKVNFMQEIQKIQNKLVIAELELGRLSNHNLILQQERQNFELSIRNAEDRLVEHVQQEERKVREVLKKCEERDKQKNMIIQKLQRIIRQSRSRRQEELRLQQQLRKKEIDNDGLHRQLTTLRDTLRQRESQLLEARRLTGSRSTDKVSSSLMNVQLTNQGFQVRSFMSPRGRTNRTKNTMSPRLDQSQLESRCIQQTHLLLHNMIEREKTLQTEMEEIRKQTKFLDEKMGLVGHFFCKKCQRFEETGLKQHQCKPINGQITLQLESISPNSISVPIYIVRDVGSKQTATYQIQLIHDGQILSVRKSFQEICQLRKALLQRWPQAASPVLYQSNSFQGKRKGIEDFLKGCLMVKEYREGGILSRFLSENAQIVRQQENLPTFNKKTPFFSDQKKRRPLEARQ